MQQRTAFSAVLFKYNVTDWPTSFFYIEENNQLYFVAPYTKKIHLNSMGVFSWQSIDHKLNLGWIFHMQMRERSTQLHTVEISWPLLNAPLFSMQLTTVERSYIFCAVDHCWTLLFFLCSWPLLNAPIFSVRLTTVERSYVFCAVNLCWTLLYSHCGWPLLNAPIFSLFVEYGRI